MKYKENISFSWILIWIRLDKIHHQPMQQSHYPNLQLLKPDELAMYALKNYSSFRISVCNALFDLNMLRLNHMRFIDTIFWEDLAFTYDLAPKVNRAVLLSDITYHYLCRPGSLSQYQDRDKLDMEEILRNVSTIDYLKEAFQQYKYKDYFPFLCYNLEVNSFYVVCYVLKYRHKIQQPISYKELRDYMHFPVDLSELLLFKNKRLQCLALWMIAHLPLLIFVFVIRGLGKIKRIL